MPREVNATLRQKGNFGQIREYQVLDEKELRVSTRYKNRHFAYLVSLLALEGEGELRFEFAWRWLIAAAVPLCLLLVYWAVVQFGGVDIGVYAVPLLAGLVLLAVAFLALFAMNTCRWRLYHAQNSRVELLRLRTGKPSQREYKVFIDVLEAYINKCRDHWRLTQEQQLAGELRTLRRLAGEKVISHAVYEQAKRRLFALRSAAPQGSASAG